MAVTLGDLKTRALRLADVPADSTSRSDAVIADAELTDIANEGLHELRDLLVESWEGYLSTDSTTTMSAGVNYTSLPSDFYKLEHLFMLDGNERRELDSWDFKDLSGSTNTDTADVPYYRIRGDRIIWWPLPASTKTVEIWYVKQFAELVNDTDTLDSAIMPGWEKYIIAHMAEYILAKEERDMSAAVMMKEQTRQKITASASNRDASRPRHTPEVTGRYRRNYRYPYPRV